MKIRADHVVTALPPGPLNALERLRALRAFDAEQWLDAKVQAMAHYWRQAGLSGAVLGVSGGIDSAVVAGLIDRVARLENSPLTRWEMLALPALTDAGVTGQQEALARAKELEAAFAHPVREVDVSDGMPALRAPLTKGLGIDIKPWASGQAVAVSRTLLLYQAASLLAQEGHPALVVGTTNRDEGAYLGYVGKASDGMVDLQVLSDLHKSEVYAVARLLGVPASILDVVPTGDMFDACADTDVFGAPYDAVELLILSRTLWDEATWQAEKTGWSTEDRAIWEQAEASLEALHRYNAHKYNVGSPAVHLDLLDSAMPGGWRPSRPESWSMPSTVATERPASRAFPAGDRRAWFRGLDPDEKRATDQDGLRVFVPSLVNPAGVATLLESLETGPWQAADRHGQWRQGVRSEAPSANEGSWRTTVDDPALAAALWEALRHRLPAFRCWSSSSKFDGAGTPVWRPVGINPVFRVMRYQEGGWLVPHYDGPFVMDARRQTGMTVVLYLEESTGGGGQLRFLKDDQQNLPFEQRCFDDKTEPATEADVETIARTRPGDAWVFDHRQLHDSSLLTHGRKTLIRTDVIFEKVGP